MTDPIGKNGLKFFGSVIASISHEIKNRIAIINEQAGLLEDLIYMQGQGQDVEPERLKKVADSVKKQVATADGIIKNMNRFAHTTDELFPDADQGFGHRVALEELISMSAALSKRMADMHGVRLEVRPGPCVTVNTSPFFLMNLIWLCVNKAIETVGKQGVIGISCQDNTENGAHLRIDMTGTDQENISLPEHATGLTELLGARIESEKELLLIHLPADIGSDR